MAKEKKQLVADAQKMEAIDLKVIALLSKHTDDADQQRLIEAEINRLCDEKERLMGLSADEIARVEQEVDALAEAQARGEFDAKGAIEQLIRELLGNAKGYSA